MRFPGRLRISLRLIAIPRAKCFIFAANDLIGQKTENNFCGRSSKIFGKTDGDIKRFHTPFHPKKSIVFVPIRPTNLQHETHIPALPRVMNFVAAATNQCTLQ